MSISIDLESYYDEISNVTKSRLNWPVHIELIEWGAEEEMTLTLFELKQNRNHLLRTQLRDRNTPVMCSPYITRARNPPAMTTQNAILWKAKEVTVLRRLCCENNILFQRRLARPLKFSVKSKSNRSLRKDSRWHTISSFAAFHDVVASSVTYAVDESEGIVARQCALNFEIHALSPTFLPTRVIIYNRANIWAY